MSLCREDQVRTLNLRFFVPFVLMLMVVATASLGGCGGGAPVEPKGNSEGELSGLVVFPVAAGTVTAFKLDPATVKRGESLATAVTDESGVFALTLPAYNGAVLLVASTGTYSEPALGVPAKLDGFELTLVLPAVRAGEKVADLRVSPISTFATAVASHRVKNADEQLAPALDEAFIHLNNHFGGVDWRKVVPADLGIERGAQLDDAAKAGLVMSALSMQARLISESANITPGSAVTMPTMIEALTADLAFDGFFDGVSGQGQLVLPRGTPVASSPPTGTRFDDFTARTELSRSLALFLEGDRNRSGIKAADVLSFRDALSTNANPRLFRTGGGKDDDKAPTVSFSTSFVVADGGSRIAVGSPFLVNRSLIVTVDATDPAGVKSLAVTVDGASLTPLPQGNTTTHFVGTWTAADAGALTFSAAVADLRGNSGSVTNTVMVDTQAPTSFVIKPVMPTLSDGGTADFVGFLSSTLHVEATATDDHSLASLTIDGLEGFVDNDSAVNHAVGTWTPPMSETDGLKQFRVTSCDAVENCTATVVPFGVDRTPPLVLVDPASAPADYTKTTTISFSVVADDDGINGAGAGVKQVYAQVNAVTYLATRSTTDPTAWMFTGVALAPGRNVFTVWADDLASPSNSAKGTNREATFTVIHDVSAPTVTSVPQLSYLSEQGLDFQRNANGAPVMPVVYTQTASTKTDVSTATDIYKAVQRLKCGSSPPQAGPLESGNPRNIPFYKFAVNYDAATDSPIVSATFRVQYQGQSSFEPEVDLVASTAQAQGQLFFLLPICTETFAKLFQSMNLPMFIQVRVTDGAGNIGGTSFSTPLLRIVGTPVAVVEDANYSNINDAKSFYVYRRSAQNYQQLFDPANASLATGVRVLRYVIYNPSDEPIAFRTYQTNGIHSLVEGWPGATFALTSAVTGGTTYVVDGNTFALSQPWDSAPSSRVSTACSIPASEVYPCGAQNRDVNFPYHQVGSSTGYSCRNQPLPPYSASVNIPQGQPWSTLEYFKSPSPTGNEATAAESVGTAYKLVPAASGNAPGQLVLYVKMSRATTSTAARAVRPLIFQGNPVDASSRYQFWYADYWQWTGGAAYQCGSTADTQLMQYAANRWYEQLQSATESVTYAHDVFTQALVSDSAQPSGYALFGPSTKVIANASTSRTFNH